MRPLSLLVIGFNRPDLLRQVLDRIPDGYGGKVFFSADGPREGVETDQAMCAEVDRLFLSKVGRMASARYQKSKTNLGCRAHVIGAIDWFFSNVEEGAILEDDCLPSPDFFDYCSELLDRYRDDPRVMHVSGDNSFGLAAPKGASYGFSLQPLIWGWATWRRAWLQNDGGLASWASVRNTAEEKRLWPSRRERLFRKSLLDSITVRGIPDTWDAQWAYSVRLMGGLAVMPSVNLVTNIGFRADATHTKKPGHFRDRVEARRILPLTHPASMQPTMHVKR